jgi:hypothetical protein
VRHKVTWLAMLGVAALALGLVGALGTRATAQQAAATPGDPAQLAADAQMLTALQKVHLTGAQATRAADALTTLADAADKAQAEESRLLDENAALLASVRAGLLSGEELDPAMRMAYEALARDLATARAGRHKAQAECARLLGDLLTADQREMAALKLRAEHPGKGALRSPADLLPVVRQWTDEAYAKDKASLVDRVVGKEATDATKEKVAALLDEARALDGEQFGARRAALTEELLALRGDPAAAAGADPFGAPPAAAAKPAREPLGILAVARMVRKLDDAAYQQRRPEIVSRVLKRAGADAADQGVTEKLGALLDEIRATPEADLRAAAPDIGRRLAEALPGLDAPRAKVRDGAVDAGSNLVAGALARLATVGDPRHVADLLREYAEHAPTE